MQSGQESFLKIIPIEKLYEKKKPVPCLGLPVSFFHWKLHFTNQKRFSMDEHLGSMQHGC